MTLQIPLLRSEPDPEPPAAAQPAAAETAAPAPQPAGHALVRPEGGRMGALEQCVTTVRHAFLLARRHGKSLAERDGGWVNGLLAGKPPSVNGQRDYLANRRWLPPGHEGGIAEKAGTWYHRLVGIPGVAFGNWISATCARPFRFAWTAVIFAGLIALLWLII